MVAWRVGSYQATGEWEWKHLGSLPVAVSEGEKGEKDKASLEDEAIQFILDCKGVSRSDAFSLIRKHQKRDKEESDAKRTDI